MSDSFTKDGIFFEENISVYEPRRQRRYWLIAGVLLGLTAAWLLYTEVKSIPRFQRRLQIQYFNLITRVCTTLISIGALVLYFRKRRLGWILTAGIVTFLLTLLITTTAFLMYYRGLSAFRVITTISLIVYTVIACIIYMPMIWSIYSVSKPVARRTALIAALVAIVLIIVQIVKPHLR